MSIERVVEPLRRLPIFRGLQEEQLIAIARAADKVRFRRGETITRAGEPGDGAFIVVSGSVEREPEPGLLAPAEPIELGSMIGELAMLIDHDYGSTTRACDVVLCLKLTREAMHAMMLDDSALAEHFREHIAGRLLRFAEELRTFQQILSTSEPTDAEADCPAVAAVHALPSN